MSAEAPEFYDLRIQVARLKENLQDAEIRLEKAKALLRRFVELADLGGPPPHDSATVRAAKEFLGR